MGEHQEKRSPVAGALRLLAQGGGLQRGDDELVSLLGGRLQALTDVWHLDLAKGAKNARIAIQVQLVAHLRQIAPKSRRPQGGPYPSLIDEQRFAQFERVVLVLFNVNSWFTGEFEGPDQKDRYKWLDTDRNHQRGDSRISYRIKSATARRDMDHAIAEIAKALAGGGVYQEVDGLSSVPCAESAIAAEYGDVADASDARSMVQTINDLDPLMLGVHIPMTVGGNNQAPLPLYVERKHDHQLRTLLSDPAASIMIVLTGGSSTGKTRTALEAVKICLPDWQFLVPSNVADISRYADEQEVHSRTVVWLDEAHVSAGAEIRAMATLPPTSIPRPGPQNLRS